MAEVADVYGEQLNGIYITFKKFGSKLRCFLIDVFACSFLNVATSVARHYLCEMQRPELQSLN